MKKRALGWADPKLGLIIPVCDMEDEYLITAITHLRSKILAVRVTSGVTSLSLLTLNYLIDEAKDRGLNVNETIFTDSSIETQSSDEPAAGADDPASP